MLCAIINPHMNLKHKDKSFGKRLTSLRKERGLTMKELAAKLDVSLRSLFYYEKKSNQPPAHLLTAICRELDISADELLGLKPLKKKSAPEETELLKKLKKIKSLPPTDQRALFHYLNALVAKNRKRP